MKSQTKRYIVGIPLCIIMLPVILLGFLYHQLSTYFVSGVASGKLVDEMIEAYLDRG